MSQADRFRSEIIAASAGQAEDVAQSAAEAARKVNAVNDVIQELRIAEFAGAGGNGSVTASVNGMCEVQSIYVSPTAMRELGHEALGAAVVDAVEKARATALEQVAERIQETTGETFTPVDKLKLPDDPLNDFMKKLRDLGTP